MDRRRHVFAFIDIRGVSVAAGTVHMVCAYWGFALMSLHLGLHWGMMLGAVRKLFAKPEAEKDRKAKIWITRLLGAAIAAYGLGAFVRRDLLSYMLLRVHFVFFDYSEPALSYIFDCTAVMGMFVFLGHYLGRGLQRIGKRRRREH